MIRRGRFVDLTGTAGKALRAMLGENPKVRTFDIVFVVNGARRRRLTSCHFAADLGADVGCRICIGRAEAVNDV